MENHGEIKLVQKPVIAHQLKEAGAQVTARIATLEIDKLVACQDSFKALKDLRAELNKEAKAFEDQRIFIKKAIASPYTEFEALYNSEIRDKYKEAGTQLKDKIEVVEKELKDERRGKVVTYFEELRVAKAVQWLNWDDLGLEINLSTSIKKYKEQVDAYVNQTRDDLDLIAQEEHHAEILVLYKQCHNVSHAITTVKTRKKAEAEEKERIKQDRTRGRIKDIKDLGMVKADIGNFYEYNTAITVRTEEIEDLDEQVWTVVYIGLEGQIKEAEAVALGETKADEVAQQQTPAAPVGAPEKVQPAATTQATETAQEEIVEARFWAKAPYPVLKALGQFMRDNDIEYGNIE